MEQHTTWPTTAAKAAVCTQPQPRQTRTAAAAAKQVRSTDALLCTAVHRPYTLGGNRQGRRSAELSAAMSRMHMHTKAYSDTHLPAQMHTDVARMTEVSTQQAQATAAIAIGKQH